ncbi:MmpS family protein [Micromonospora sp. CPCC 205371]|nr:MmpS family protein [Micromonospora sp. CPCC 205371]
MEVTGAKSADITYGLGADQSQEQGAKLPWKKTLKSSEALVIPTIVAQNKGGGTINCKITVDGKVIKETAPKARSAVVTCTPSWGQRGERRPRTHRVRGRFAVSPSQ